MLNIMKIKSPVRKTGSSRQTPPAIIREVFWMTDVESGRMLYISPGYEDIWGRTCASLYASPLDWLEAVLPEDRPRVRQAARYRQTTGDYDEQYRILRPDGAVRWIHDRAFPVRDERGAIYRVTGVAEDVTGRMHLQSQVLEISDRERGRIGRDLHDGLSQLLVCIGFNVNALRQDLEQRSRAEAKSAEWIGQKMSEAIKMARDLAHGLCPVDFQNENLATALRRLAQGTTEDYKVPCVAECKEAAPVSDPVAATHLYRIAQEAVHNAVKHGQPGRILIGLTAKDGRARLSITDNGRGLPSKPPPGAGMGLEIMRYRASVLCGTLEVRALEAPEGHGTRVSCTFPGEAIWRTPSAWQPAMNHRAPARAPVP